MSDELYEVFEDDEVLELREIEVDSVGLVPSGANQRRYIIMKGGEETMDATKVAEAITADEKFWDKLVAAFSDQDVEKQGKAEARRKMALRILGVDSVEEAIRALGGQAKAEDEEEEEEKAAAEEEEEEEKAAEEDEEEEEEEEYPKPSTKDKYAELFAQMQTRLEASEAIAQQALRQLQDAQRDSRKQELAQQAEKFAALPEVKPEEFANTLFELEQASPELYAAVVSVLEPAANAMREVYGEVGTRQSDGTGIAFLDRVEGRTREIQTKETQLTYEEAYSQAFDQISSEEPKLALAYLERADR